MTGRISISFFTCFSLKAFLDDLSFSKWVSSYKKFLQAYCITLSLWCSQHTRQKITFFRHPCHSGIRIPTLYFRSDPSGDRTRVYDKNNVRKADDFAYCALNVDWKSHKMSHDFFLILAFSINLCPMKVDLSGNTVWPQVSGFHNSPNWPILAFLANSLSTHAFHSQYWMRLFLWFSNTLR